MLTALVSTGCLVDGDDLPPPPARAEERCNDEDDDYDGVVDEDFELGALCEIGVGNCATIGAIRCQDGEAACVSERVADDPGDEVCNRRDDDCDGDIDEGFGLGEACMVGSGRCQTRGEWVCGADQDAICDAPPPTLLERRSEEEGEVAVDDDCDGKVDEADEVCDGQDNDLDGEIDEPPTHVLCGLSDDELSRSGDTGALLCRDGRCEIICYMNRVDADGDLTNGCECIPDGTIDIGRAIERVPHADVGACPVADGVDNDCDGHTDEHPTAAEIAEGLGPTGVCGALSYICDGGAWRPPEVEDAAGRLPDFGDETLPCDGLDNDCDGRADERLDCFVCGEGEDRGPPCFGCADGTPMPAGFACIGAGDFVMGAADEDAPAIERPARRVRIDRAVVVQRDEVSRAEWQAILAQRFEGGVEPPGACEHDDACPVHGVTWFEAVFYANLFSEREGLELCYALDECAGTPGTDFSCASVARVGPPCEGYRLPTEAEWEFVARAGGVGAFGLYDGQEATAEDLPSIAWYSGSTDRSRSGAKRPNEWGLYDVLGNVGEWVDDWYGPYPDPAEAPQVDPVGPEMGERRVWRGGSWTAGADSCRVSSRAYTRPDVRDGRIGFRLIRTVHGP